VITQTLTAGQLSSWLAAHGLSHPNQRINATARARSEHGFVLAFRGRRHTVRRLVVEPRVYYTVDSRSLRG
jgi:hypothetical protein